MPHDVTMPQLGMAQDAGRIVAWAKAPGDAVARGDVLFEVETDKATMEVEAQADGYLSAVSASAGDDVPVGQIIARIADSPGEVADPPAPNQPTGGDGAAGDGPSETGGDGSADELPDGHSVTMPQLGMAQDTGVLVGWQKQPGDAVAADDVLFEVETDKSTMEVEAGRDGYLAATLAEAGEEVPVGSPVAVISPEAPANPVARSVKQARAPAPTPPAETEQPAASAPEPASKAPKSAPTAAPGPSSGGRILASPKARRLALEEGLDLSRLAEAGHPQPYHVKDLDTLRAMPAGFGPGTAVEMGPQSRHLTAELPREEFSTFAAWAADHAGLSDAPALLAGLAGGCLDGAQTIVAYEAFGRRRLFRVPRGPLSAVAEVEEGAPDLVLRDLRATRITGLHLGAEEAPTLTLAAADKGLSLTLECAAGHLSAAAAVSLASEFAGRLEQPLRHLL